MQLLAFVLIYPFLWVISILPHRLFYGFSDIAFFFVFHVFGYRRKVVQNNLNLVFPNKPKQEINAIEKEFYKHLCDTFLEMIKTMNLSKKAVAKKYDVINPEVLLEIEKERSIIILCAHYANWEWNVSINNYVKSKGYAVYQKVNNKHFDNFIRKTRARWNTTLITQAQTAKTIIQNFRNDIRATYGMVSDQSPQAHRAHYWTDFMGITVPIFNGGEALARKTGLATVFLKVSKVKRGHYKAELIPISINSKETKEHEITNKFLRLTEQQINENPAYYLWTHKRWKHRGKIPAAFAEVN
ncbi:lysophospholipid acyltransferase family protein [Maribacter hydrothermalis]|uniref:Lipid A biosynthesis acyltransferase n=1 Tax=Maribacter hydrothermalis TaxID=1836467 RepID=A0A1B7Z882_9FLAO|nr:lysophospholipid acyltransferase family protein [Maribacter hydrothermalis]APQ19099.1 lipid A biosynthesis acyltransferase [Maribacter hydrothermalis]OBR38889.1 lipid A biosynthesis acyltransferase [Maribacter hydrothermalis]